MNWPVARVLQPFLAGIGTPLYPHLQRIMQTDDDVWKNWILRFIIAQSAELQAMFRTDLERLATHPTAGEQAEGLDVIAKELLSQRSPAGAKRNPG
ncbi:hypothetical protein M2236_006478 [Bradyrhizobium elkanii]|nr:hypothetical protein [Bradyrhizobium elkanii]